MQSRRCKNYQIWLWILFSPVDIILSPSLDIVQCYGYYSVTRIGYYSVLWILFCHPLWILFSPLDIILSPLMDIIQSSGYYSVHYGYYSVIPYGYNSVIYGYYSVPWILFWHPLWILFCYPYKQCGYYSVLWILFCLPSWVMDIILSCPMDIIQSSGYYSVTPQLDIIPTPQIGYYSGFLKKLYSKLLVYSKVMFIDKLADLLTSRWVKIGFRFAIKMSTAQILWYYVKFYVNTAKVHLQYKTRILTVYF